MIGLASRTINYNEGHIVRFQSLVIVKYQIQILLLSHMHSSTEPTSDDRPSFNWQNLTFGFAQMV